MVRSVLRAAGFYLLGCAMAALWLLAYLGAPTLMFGDVSPELGALSFYFTLAVVGCSLPVLVGRLVLRALDVSWVGFTAAIWALAGTMVAGGVNPLNWYDWELIAGISLPGAVIGTVLHVIETRGVQAT